MKEFTTSAHCHSRAHCVECRSNPAWRASVGAPDTCPHGVTGLGDLIEKIARPIAKLLGIPCHDKKGQLKPESNCAKRRDKLNKIVYNTPLIP